MWGSCWIALECPRGELIVSSGRTVSVTERGMLSLCTDTGLSHFRTRTTLWKSFAMWVKARCLVAPTFIWLFAMRVYLVRRVSLFAHWLPFQKDKTLLKQVCNFWKNYHILEKCIFKCFMETASLTRLSSVQPLSPVKSKGVTLKDRRLCVSQAYRKQKRSESAQTAVLLLGHTVAAHHSF